MIEVKNLIFEYPTNRALNDVSFTIERGTITALVGPNGAGKTTLMRCLTALSTPLSGEIHINNIDIFEHPRELNKIVGYMPDFFGLYDQLTIRQALRYFALAYQLEETSIEKRIVEVVEQLNLTEKLDEKLGALSRGMRQRVAIGQAIIHNPELLILDEPASGLDPEARSALAQLFRNLNEAGMTIIVSSHILSELDEYANNLIMLRNGKISTKNEEEAQSEKNFIISVSEGFKELCDKLTSKKEVTILEIGKDACTIQLEGISQQVLLKELIKEGVQIKDFYEKKVKLQEQYMNLLQEEQKS